MAEHVVAVPQDAGVAAVASIRLELLAAMDEAGPDDVLVLDLGRIRNADSAFAQLVIAFKHEARLRKQPIVIEGESSKNSIAALLGCDVVCDACAFNDFKARASREPAGLTITAKAKSRTASKAMRSKA